MFEQRLLTAILLIPVLIVVTLKCSTLVFSLLLGIFILIAAYEWTLLAGIRQPLARALYCAAVLLLLVTLGSHLSSAWLMPLLLVTIAGWCLALGMITLYQSGRAVLTGSPTVKTLIGGFILVPPWLALVALHAEGQGPALILLLFFLIWAADSGAYFIGRRFGRRRLMSRISPAKSWEGAEGGLLIALLFLALYLQLVGTGGINIVWLAVLCFITVVFSVVGDLVESFFKRHANIKDSGSLLPGHGGVLDRIDSLCAAVPVFVAGLGLLGEYS